METKPTVYLDTGVFIALVKSETDRVAACRDALQDASEEKTWALTSALTVAEVVRGEGGTIPESAEPVIDSFFSSPWLRVAVVDQRVAMKAREISRLYHLKPPDAIHVATAILYGASRIFTYDKDMLELTIPSIRISHPETIQPRLPFLPSAEP